jgi:hypothetical protein
LKETSDRSVDLIFPSQFIKERPDAPEIRGQEVIFAFEGPLHNIYATLAVRLSHSELFQRQDMWQNTASFEAVAGGVCGIHLRELEEGRGELLLFFSDDADKAVRRQFEAYVAEHLRLRVIPGTLIRRPILICSCGYLVDGELIKRRLRAGATTMTCPACEDSVLSLTEEPTTPDAMASAAEAVAEMNQSADKRRDQGSKSLLIEGKRETGDYDVFLCYNRRDDESVRAIAERLMDRGILPWLDVWDIRPGTRWQDELVKRLKSIKAVAVFRGPGGRSPWQELEVGDALGRFARQHRPLIPVILEGVPGKPAFPAFLDGWHRVDMRQPDPDPFEQLIWGITGKKTAKD